MTEPQDSRRRNSRGSGPRKRSRKNKGEWAELYAFASMLVDGKIRVWGHGNKGAPGFVHLTEVRRDVSRDSEHVRIRGNHLDLIHAGHRIARSSISANLRKFRSEILRGASPRRGEKGAFHPPHGEALLRQLAFISDGVGGRTKSDLHINVRDPLVGPTGLEGYTIKSFMGAPPTLLNPSGATKFKYSIKPSVPAARLEMLKQMEDVRLKFQALDEWGYELQLSEMNETFRMNLELIDVRMPELVAELLRYFVTKERGGSSIPSLVSAIATRNPLRVGRPEIWYSHKVKDLLEASSYGMVPSSPWDGRRSAAGGLIIVDSEGRLFCFPHRSRDENRDFLYRTTSLVSPGHAEKLGNGLVNGSGRSCTIQTCLQIRYRSGIAIK